MSGPYVDGLNELDGPAVPWQSAPLAVPVGGAGHDLGLALGANRGVFGTYLRNISDSDGYATSDTIALHPDMMQPVGSPGSGVALRTNPSRLTSRVLQDIYAPNRTSGARADLGGSANFKLHYRGIFAAGRGPYPVRQRGQAPDGVLVSGETPEFSMSGTFVEVGNRTGIDPFMWTLFGRCLVADGGCQPGDIMAFGSAKQAGTTRGWGTSYSTDLKRFTLSQFSAIPFMIGKDGNFFTPTLASWAFFFRFVGLAGSTFAMRTSRLAQPRLWMSPPVPLTTLTPVSTACAGTPPPALVMSALICRVAEFGYGVGDWIVAQEGNNNSSVGGFSATFDGRNVTLAPYTTQFTHSLVDGTANALTAANWSWFFVFVG